MSKIEKLAELGQSLWLDFISRDYISGGKLLDMISEGLRGITSNPTIFEKAIAGSNSYDSEIAELTGKVANLENEIEATRRYNENIRNILTGNVESMTEKAVKKQGQPENPADTLPKDVDRIPEDEKLRSAVATGTFTADNKTAAAPLNSLARDIPLEQLFFMPPVSGEITAKFDLSKNHYGIDVAAPKNTAVKSTADGSVISAGYTVETGYSIAVQHPNNVVTIYKHNSVLLRREGDYVKEGEAIAIIGNSGENTSGPHIHFELWHKGRAVDPALYINFQ